MVFEIKCCHLINDVPSFDNCYLIDATSMSKEMMAYCFLVYELLFNSKINVTFWCHHHLHCTIMLVWAYSILCDRRSQWFKREIHFQLSDFWFNFCTFHYSISAINYLLSTSAMTLRRIIARNYSNTFFDERWFLILKKVVDTNIIITLVHKCYLVLMQ